jgi:hypothetical protein
LAGPYRSKRHLPQNVAGAALPCDTPEREQNSASAAGHGIKWPLRLSVQEKKL